MKLITGAFDGVREAEAAVRALHAAGFALEDEGSEPMTAPELEASSIHSSPGAEHAGSGSARGAAAGGAVGAILGLGAIPFAGALGVLSGIGVGAYAGSLLGALRGIGDGGRQHGPGTDAGSARVEAERSHPEEEHLEGEGPRFVVVRAARPEGRDRAIHILNEHGATRVTELEHDERDD